jgi:hypothetical protein
MPSSPDSTEPAGVSHVGYQADRRIARPDRRPFDEVVHRERW